MNCQTSLVGLDQQELIAQVKAQAQEEFQTSTTLLKTKAAELEAQLEKERAATVELQGRLADVEKEFVYDKAIP